MSTLQRITIPAYATAVLLIGIPLLDVALAIWPVAPGESTWRFGAVGLLSRSLVTPLLGLLLLLGAGLVRESAGALRVASVLSAALTIFLVGCLGLYALDGLEVRALMTPAQNERFLLTAGVAAAKLGAATIVAAVYAVVGWIAAGASSGRARRKAEGAGVIVAGASHRVRPRGSGGETDSGSDEAAKGSDEADPGSNEALPVEEARPS